MIFFLKKLSKKSIKIKLKNSLAIFLIKIKLIKINKKPENLKKHSKKINLKYFFSKVFKSMNFFRSKNLIKHLKKLLICCVVFFPLNILSKFFKIEIIIEHQGQTLNILHKKFFSKSNILYFIQKQDLLVLNISFYTT